MVHRDELIGFRFFALSPAQLDELRKVCPDAQGRPARKREGFIVGSFTLHAGGDYSWLKPFIQACQIPACDYGLFVSVSTSSESAIVRLPEFAADIFHDVGGVMDFSFTVLSDE